MVKKAYKSYSLLLASVLLLTHASCTQPTSNVDNTTTNTDKKPVVNNPVVAPADLGFKRDANGVAKIDGLPAQELNLTYINKNRAVNPITPEMISSTQIYIAYNNSGSVNFGTKSFRIMADDPNAPVKITKNGDKYYVGGAAFNQISKLIIKFDIAGTDSSIFVPLNDVLKDPTKTVNVCVASDGSVSIGVLRKDGLIDVNFPSIRINKGQIQSYTKDGTLITTNIEQNPKSISQQAKDDINKTFESLIKGSNLPPISGIIGNWKTSLLGKDITAALENNGSNTFSISTTLDGKKYSGTGNYTDSSKSTDTFSMNAIYGSESIKLSINLVGENKLSVKITEAPEKSALKTYVNVPFTLQREIIKKTEPVPTPTPVPPPTASTEAPKPTHTPVPTVTPSNEDVKPNVDSNTDKDLTLKVLIKSNDDIPIPTPMTTVVPTPTPVPTPAKIEKPYEFDAFSEYACYDEYRQEGSYMDFTNKQIKIGVKCSEGMTKDKIEGIKTVPPTNWFYGHRNSYMSKNGLKLFMVWDELQLNPNKYPVNYVFIFYSRSSEYDVHQMSYVWDLTDKKTSSELTADAIKYLKGKGYTINPNLLK